MQVFTQHFSYTNYWWIGICLTIFSCTLTVFAQDSTKKLSEANKHFNAGAYEQAIPLYRDVLMVDNSLEAKTNLAEAYRLTGNYKKAEYWYAQLLKLVPQEPTYKLHYARSLQSNGKCKEAQKWFLEYGKFDDLGNTLAKGCDQIKTFEKEKNNYEILLLPINSPNSDFSPVFHKNGIAFCSNRSEIPRKTASRAKSFKYLDLFFAEKQLGNAYTPPKKLKGKINSSFNEGPLTVSTDGTQIYFTRNHVYKGKAQKSREGTVKLAVFSSRLVEKDKWEDIAPFQHNNPQYSVAHPTLSANGQNLYFISDMLGGYGGTDLYVCTKIDTFWSQPINLGKEINTSGNEMFPFIHADGTLYFASNGHPGLGGMDIFKTQRKASGKWTTPENMGRPINSNRDDFSIVISTNRQHGYFASNREGGFGSDDLYSFNYTDPNAPINPNPDPILDIAHPILLDITLEAAADLRKVKFNRGDWTLLPESLSELDELAAYLSQNPEVTVEIGAHTDSKGDDYINHQISGLQADAVRTYLAQKGIDANRIVGQAYGETQLLNHCANKVPCNDKDHAINNRIEAIVLSVSGSPLNEPIRDVPGLDIGDDPTFQFDTPTPSNTDNDSFNFDDLKATSDKPAELPEAGASAPSLTENLNYRIHIGPYKNVENDVYYRFAELNTGIDLTHTSKGMMIVLGPYDTIKEAQQYQNLAKERGAKKTKILVFNNDQETDLSIKKLKKMGIE